MDELNDEGCEVEGGAARRHRRRSGRRRLVDAVVAGHGRLDYIFNNAGIVVLGRGGGLLLRGLAPGHRRQPLRRGARGDGGLPGDGPAGPGHIVNTASAAGLFPSAREISYTASKYGVVGLSNALRVEGARYGVKVSVVCPGFIDTPIYGETPGCSGSTGSG